MTQTNSFLQSILISQLTATMCTPAYVWANHLSNGTNMQIRYAFKGLGQYSFAVVPSATISLYGRQRIDELNLANLYSEAILTAGIGAISGIPSTVADSVAQFRQLSQLNTTIPSFIKRVYHSHGLPGLFSGNLVVMYRQSLFATSYIYCQDDCRSIFSWGVFSGLATTYTNNQLRFFKQKAIAEQTSIPSYRAIINATLFQPQTGKLQPNILYKGVVPRTLSMTAGIFAIKKIKMLLETPPPEEKPLPSMP